MGNSKSRHSNGPSASSHHRHSNKYSSSLLPPRDSSSTHNFAPSSGTFPGQQPLPNDSGHYSMHGSIMNIPPPPSRAEFGGGAYHSNNLSSPGRLDQQKKSSDSSLQQQYGTRIKRATGNGISNNNNNGTTMGTVGSGGGRGSGILSSNGHMNGSGSNHNTSTLNQHSFTPGGQVSSNELSYSSGILRSSGTGQTRANPMATGGNSAELGGVGNVGVGGEHIHNGVSPRDLDPSRPLSGSLNATQSNGRTSAFAIPSQQQLPSSSPLHNNNHGHPGFSSYRMSSPSPSPLGGRDDDMQTNSLAVATMNMGVHDSHIPGRGSIQQQQSHRYQQQQLQQQQIQLQQQLQQQQRRDFETPAYAHRQSSIPPPQMSSYQQSSGNYIAPALHPSRLSQVDPRSVTPRASGYDRYDYNGQTAGVPLHQDLMGSVKPIASNNIATPPPRTKDVFADAGPLIDGSSASNRALTADQVFARLAKQNPTNPRESEKKERIYRWVDNVAKALTFNPNTDIPGWIIPVVPDELDIPESPFFLDRITYELDLMAPVGRPFRKAIDVNCSSGEWAMDLALKYPRTIVYALDPTLDLSRLPLRIPENCKFKLRDVKDQEGEFDLVHQRLGAFRTQILEWTPHFAELGRLTRAGGWIQLAESNGMIIRAGVESLKVNRWVEKAALSSGLNPMQLVESLMPFILGAGLINVECYEYGIPIGDWAGRRGRVAMLSYLTMVESLREEIIEIHRLEAGIFEETIANLKHEFIAENAELVMKVICAQKPPYSDDIWR